MGIKSPKPLNIIMFMIHHFSLTYIVYTNVRIDSFTNIKNQGDHIPLVRMAVAPIAEDVLMVCLFRGKGESRAGPRRPLSWEC